MIVFNHLGTVYMPNLPCNHCLFWIFFMLGLFSYLQYLKFHVDGFNYDSGDFN